MDSRPTKNDSRPSKKIQAGGPGGRGTAPFAGSSSAKRAVFHCPARYPGDTGKKLTISTTGADDVS
jgi:hypothetical protein